MTQPATPPHLREPNKPSPIDEVRAAVKDRVEEGYDTRDEIVDFITDVYGSDLPDPNVSETIGRLTDEALAEHQRQEATWKATDCDRLERAFKTLEAKGILAREKYSDCQTCGVAEISREMKEERKKGRKVIGYTFFHDQDVEGVVESGQLGLAYGPASDDDADAVKVGRQIVASLEAAGLKTRWSGDIRDRIALVDLKWQKRRAGQQH